MMELDFRGCKTKEDVGAVFEDKKLSLLKDIHDLGKLRLIFFEDDVKEEDKKG